MGAGTVAVPAAMVEPAVIIGPVGTPVPVANGEGYDTDADPGLIT